MIRNLTVKNDGWVPTALSEGETAAPDDGGVPEAIQVRGFRFDKKDCHRIEVTEGER